MTDVDLPIKFNVCMCLLEVESNVYLCMLMNFWYEWHMRYL